MAIGDCKTCGAVNSTGWGKFVDEDGFEYDDREDHCDHCLDVMAERSQKRREWEHYHDEPCPEIELPSIPTRINAAKSAT